MPSVSDSDHLAEVIDWLYQRRKGLSCVYGVILLCMVSVGLLGPAAIVSKLHWQQSAYAYDSRPKFFLLVFSLATQTLFLWGGGRIVHERKSSLRVVLPSLVTVLILVFSAGLSFGNLVTWDFELEPTREDWMLYVVSVVTLASVLPAAIIKSRRSDHYRTLAFLNILMLMGVWIASSLTLALTLAKEQAWGWSDSLAVEAFIPAYLLTFVLGTSLVLLWRRSQASEKERKKESIGEEQLDNAATLEAGPYIASAASVSSLLLVVLYFGVSQGISYSSQLNEIGEIRRALAREAFATYVRPVLKTADLQTILNAENEADTDDLRKAVSDTIRNVSVSPPLGIAKEKFFGTVSSDSRPLSVCMRAAITEYQLPRLWVSDNICFQLKDLITTGSGTPLSTDPSTQELAILALGHAVKLEKGEPFEALYLRIENELLRKEVAFPSSGFSFPVEQAVWLSNIVAFLMLVMLHDRLGHVLADTNLGRGEPWLILDAKDRIAKSVAALWCIGMGIGPWVLCLTTAQMALLHLGVYQSRLAFFLPQMLLIVTLFLMTGPLSISVVAYVLQLKRLRANDDTAAPAAAKQAADGKSGMQSSFSE
jgi:hypothetical protein